MRSKLIVVFVLFSFAIPFLSRTNYTATAQDDGTTTRVSVASDGTQANGKSYGPSISVDGRFVAFDSFAINLVAGDTNGARDVFVHDRLTGQTTRVSIASDGTPGNSASSSPAISADGRYVAFSSNASNLVVGDSNVSADVFVHDRQTGQTARVSVASSGIQGNANSGGQSISADGRYVAFQSIATTLVPGDTNDANDVFVHDRQTGQTTRVSVASDGTQGNDASHVGAISADGRYVVFGSYASNLASDGTTWYDVFVHDRQTGQTTCVSVSSDGTPGNGYSGNPSISADGRYVAFGSFATNLVPGDTNGAEDIFVHDRETGQTIRVSLASDGTQGNEGSYWPFISADARYVTFDSHASNLVPGDTNAKRDVFVHDLQTGQTTRESIAFDGAQSNDDSSISFISTDGRYVAFWSSASNLVSGDTNGVDDIFVRDRGSSATLPPGGPPYVTSGFQWPVDDPHAPAPPRGPFIGYLDNDTHNPSCLHHAKDFLAPEPNGPIYAVAEGLVTRVSNNTFLDLYGNSGGYGQYVIIWHKMPDNTDVFSLYSHLLPGSVTVAQGAQVERGQIIGLQGTSGGANGIEHLHFELTREQLPQTKYAAAKCPTTREIADQYYYDPAEFISKHYWESQSVADMTALAVSIGASVEQTSSATLNPGQQTGVFQHVLQAIKRALVFGLGFPGSTLEITVYRPDGSAYGVYQTDDPPLLIEVPDPEQGAWGYSIRAIDVPYEDYPYAVSTGTRDEPLVAIGENHGSDPLEGYTGDLMPPTTMLTTNPGQPNGPNGWWEVPVEITLTAVDNPGGDGVALTRYSLDGGVHFVEYAGPFIIDAEGVNTIHFYSMDLSGNKEIAQTYDVAIAFPGTDIPSAPKLNVPRDRTNTPDTTPRFAWAAVRGADRYHLQVSDQPDFGNLLVDDDTLLRTIHTVSNTTPLLFGTYHWRVRAHDRVHNWGDWSAVNTFTVTPLKTPKDGDFTKDTTPTLRWAGVGGAARYWLQVSTDAGFTNLLINEDSLTRVAFTPADPLPFGPLYWRVQVDLGGGYPPDPADYNWTPTWTFTVTPSVPVKPVLQSPANRSVTNATPDQLTWLPLGDGATYRYQVQLDDQASFRSPLQDATLDPDVTTYIPAPLSENGRAFWRVRAINEHGVAGQWSATWWFRLDALPRPTLTAPANRSTTASPVPTFEWAAVPDVAEYQVQISTDRRFGTIEQAASVTDATYPADALPDGRYYWRVRGVNAAGIAGTRSAVWQITIDSDGPDAPVLSIPKQGGATPDTTPRLAWKASRGAVEYRVQVADNLAFDSPDEWAGVTSPYLIVPDADVLDYGTYFWRVQARDVRDVWGAWSDAGTFTVTVHKSPADGSATTNERPTFRWAGVAGAQYRLQISTMPDIDADSNPLVNETPTTTSYQPPAGPAYGTLYWRVSLDDGVSWMPTWAVTVTPRPPARVGLSTPRNRSLTNDSTPTLMWKAALRGETYQVQIDDDRKFVSPAQDVTLAVGGLAYTADALPDGSYFWRVRSLNAFDAPGPWSAVWRLEIDTVAPEVPALVAPEDMARVTNRKLKLEWSRVSDAVRYEIQLDPDPAFPLPPSDARRRTSYRLPVTLGQNVYYWRVRTVDKAGNVSAWSEPRSFSLVAGNTALGAPGAIPVLDDTLVVVEAEGTSVMHSGAWAVQADPAASGGAYAVSSGEPGDLLEMAFSGTRLDVVYVQGPELGAFAVEVDGAVLLTVNGGVGASYTTAWAMLPDLAPGTHALRIVPIEGAVAVDGFVVER